MEKKLFDLLDRYLNLIAGIHDNREKIVALSKENKVKRKMLEQVKDEMTETIRAINLSDRSLYRMCMDRYGKIDKHYHYIHKMFFRNTRP